MNRPTTTTKPTQTRPGDQARRLALLPVLEETVRQAQADLAYFTTQATTTKPTPKSEA